MGAPDSTRFTTLPADVRAEDMVAGVDTDHAPEPDDVRNVDQHAALRDD
ncbi:hypothetical protein ACFQW6_16765 [Nocardioides sp. GCM10028917]